MGKFHVRLPAEKGKNHSWMGNQKAMKRKKKKNEEPKRQGSRTLVPQGTQ